MTPALASLAFALAGLFLWLASCLFRSYLREGWPGHAFASVCLAAGAGVCLSLFFGEVYPL